MLDGTITEVYSDNTLATDPTAGIPHRERLAILAIHLWVRVGEFSESHVHDRHRYVVAGDHYAVNANAYAVCPCIMRANVAEPVRQPWHDMCKAPLLCQAAAGGMYCSTSATKRLKARPHSTTRLVSPSS